MWSPKSSLITYLKSKRKKVNQKFYVQQNVSSEIREKLKTLPDKQKLREFITTLGTLS